MIQKKGGWWITLCDDCRAQISKTIRRPKVVVFLNYCENCKADQDLAFESRARDGIKKLVNKR